MLSTENTEINQTKTPVLKTLLDLLLLLPTSQSCSVACEGPSETIIWEETMRLLLHLCILGVKAPRTSTLHSFLQGPIENTVSMASVWP